MVDYNALRKILNNSKMSVKHYQNGKIAITDSQNFRGMNVSALEEAIALVEQNTEKETREFANKCGIKQIDTLKTVTERANRNIGTVIDCLNKPKADAKDMHQTIIRDSIVNNSWNLSNLSDPSTRNLSYPNIYISPYEANSLYSQKGLFETIINKKAKSILLNGCKIENPKFDQRQLDKIKEKMEVLNFKNILSEATLNSLVYGGSLLFPMFKKDTPITTTLGLNSLLKLGILKKNCIDYFINLDRWQTFIVPPYNPTQKDFMRPEHYTVPFLGSDVHNSRTARVVTAKQAGYWGQVINQGWGISDFCGYLQSGMNYKVAVQSLPLMIQQMSILARVVNVDGVLATEGSNALDALVENNTIRTREVSLDNPVTLDVLGDIKSINRNFAQVPELIRLLRQDLASDAIIPEPMLFSSEKGNFSSGDDTEGNLAKQYESVKMIHKDIEPQFKQIAKILIIDALGTDKEIIEALPYTKIHFDEPIVANAIERAQIGKYFSEEVFNLVSAQLPIGIAVEMACNNVSNEIVSADILDKLNEIQDKNDKHTEKMNELEIEQKKLEIEKGEKDIELAEENIKTQQGSSAVSTSSNKKEDKSTTKGKSPAEEQKEKALSDKKETGYSRLEQKMHEKTRGSSKRQEKKARAENKKV